MLITKIYRTETAHRIFNYEGPCSNIHGHSYKWEVTIEAEQLDLHDMVTDFKALKHMLEDTIGRFDHVIVLHKRDPLRAALEDSGVKILSFNSNPTAESFVLRVAHMFNHQFFTGGRIKLKSIKCWETETSYAEYRA